MRVLTSDMRARASGIRFHGGAMAVACLLAAGCTGSLDSSSDPAAGAATPPGDQGTSPSPADCSVPSVQESPLRRLTRTEYNNTVRDLLSDSTRPADRFVAESTQQGFNNGAASTLLSPSVVEDFEIAATALAEAAVTNLPNLLGCDVAALGEDACARDFIARFSERAFRRPMETAQLSDYEALYTSQKAQFGFVKAIELVVRAMLQSPYFLYRLEFGMPEPTESGSQRLSPHELASRLSYLFWGSMPDSELLQAAAQGRLETAADLKLQAERLLAHERGAQALVDFHLQWGQLEDVPNLQKNDELFTPAVGRLLLEETAQFIDQNLRQGDGLLSTLLTSSTGYLNGELARYYGVRGPAGTSFERFDFPPQQRSGLLTLGSFMTKLAHGAQPSPVLRGKFVLEQVLCAPPPPPPDNADTTLPAPDPTKTARQQLTELTSVQPCAGCHALINPPGFAFEHFDALGRYRADDHGLPIDAAGELRGPNDASGTFQNHRELTQLLASSEAARSCLVSKWFVYTHGRGDGEQDACSLQQMRESFGASGGNVRELLLSVTQTPAFLYRKSINGGTP